METTINIRELLCRPIWQMTGEEFCELSRYAAGETSSPQAPIRHAIGVQALAHELGCSASLLYAIKKTGALSQSVISRIGKKEVFDIELARTLANNFQTRARLERRDQK